MIPLSVSAESKKFSKCSLDQWGGQETVGCCWITEICSNKVSVGRKTSGEKTAIGIKGRSSLVAVESLIRHNF